MKIQQLKLAGFNENWDHTMLYDLLPFERELVETLQPEKRAIVVVNGLSATGDNFIKLQEELDKIEEPVLFVMSDEESRCPIWDLKHPKAHIWVQYHKPHLHQGLNFLPIGYPSHIQRPINEIEYEWSFAGQVNEYNPRRKEAIGLYRDKPNGFLLETEAFGQGLPPKEYYELISKSKTVLCPSGPEVPESFRMYEALELGRIPLIDDKTKHGNYLRYINHILHFELPHLEYPGSLEDTLVYLEKYNQFKQLLKQTIYNQLDLPKREVVYISSSYIPSHPDTKIIDETIESIKQRISDPLVVVGFDGIRDEFKDKSSDYEEYIRRVMIKHDIFPIVYCEHFHQAKSTQMSLEIIDKTFAPDHFLFIEHDTPLTGDLPLSYLVEKLSYYNVIRLYFEDEIIKEHEYLMGPKVGEFRLTNQWSQRPHLAKMSFYREILKTHFSENARCFIEDRIYSPVAACNWEVFKVVIYHPDGLIKRSYHTNGRDGFNKLDEKQIW